MNELFALMKVAEDQQKKLDETILTLSRLSGAMSDHVCEAAASGARQTMEQSTQAAAKALGTVSAPMLSKLDGVANTLLLAEKSLQRASLWLSWKFALGVSVMVAGVCLVASAYVWWLGERATALRAEVADLEIGVAELEKRGGRIKINDCGGRLCIEIAKNQGKGGWRDTKTQLEYVIPSGY